jgi:dihydroorotate dehydrogenase
MSVNLGGLQMQNPVAVASGTFGYGREYQPYMDISKIGAVIALSNGEDSIAQHIQALYEPFGDGELIERIRKELGYTHRFIQVMDKAKNQPELLSFTERRMVQEISKYVLAQCRLYTQLKA